MERRFFIAAMIVLTAAFAVSCADDMEVYNSNDGQEGKALIQFTVDDSQDWMLTNPNIQTTKAFINGAFAPKVIPIKETGKATDLYITVSTVNGISGRQYTNQHTRGTAYTTLPTNNSIGVTAYSYTGSWGTQSPNMFYNEEATYSTNDSKWSFVSPQYWPVGEQNVRFFAYSPYIATNNNGIVSANGITLSSSTVTGAPQIDFEVNTDIASQIDLMTASSDPMIYRSTLEAFLPFKHALTCVKFVLGKGLQGDIKTISLTNIVRTGTYTFDYINPYWTSGATKHTFTIGNLNLGSNNENTVVISDDGEAASTLLMIPQTFTSDDQQIELVYIGDDNHQHTITASLKGTTWLPGTTVTYKLSADIEYEYVLEATPVTISNGGGEAVYKVTSYKQCAESAPEAVPWRVVGYSVDGGNTFVPTKPDTCYWVEVSTTSGKGSTSPENGRLYIQQQLPATTITSMTEQADTAMQNKLMRANAPNGRGTYANPFDLSTHNIRGEAISGRTTANCYVINAPGNYSLPLVYGNAIANGQIVATSYTGSINQDYLGNSITSPYIYEDTNGASTPTKYEIGDAVLVWQDVPNLITNVRLDTDKKNLLFTIDSNTIRQGNAVVAVRDNNSTPRIMWSWHIWVTAHNLMNVKTFTNSDNRTYNLMPVFLGWTSKGGTMSQYAGRELVVRIQQDNGKTATFSIKQQGGMNFEGKSQGEALFYQWGRKEPLPSLSRYYESPNGYTFSAISGNSRSAFIQNPSKLINNQTFNTTNVQKAWCVNGTTNPTSATLRVTKTIYDPCPAGFHVAETGVLKDIGSNQVCGSFNKGWEYYTDDRKSTMYLPALGRMDYTSNSSSITMSLVGTYCNVWLSSLYSSTAGYIIYASSSAHDYFRYDGSPGYGRCIIAVQDY